MTKIIRKSVFALMFGSSSDALETVAAGQQGDHSHKSQDDMKHKVGNSMECTMTPMMENMAKSHIKMKEVMSKMHLSSRSAEMTKLYQDLELIMEEMGVMHENMKHKKPDNGTAKKEHNHAH